LLQSSSSAMAVGVPKFMTRSPTAVSGHERLAVVLPEVSQVRAGQVAMPPREKRRSSGALQPLRVLGVGAGGIKELAARLDESTVSWALLRFQVGGGTFARLKTVAIHSNGGLTPVMLRGWLNARKAEVLSQFGDVNAHIEVTRTEEMTIEYLCERLLPLFASDSMDYSLQALRSEYDRAVESMQKEAQDLASKDVKVEPPTVAYAPSREEALCGVGEDGCSYNWALLEPTHLKLHAAGFGGLEEMKLALAPDLVLFGILRLSFGCSDRSVAIQTGVHVRLTKHAFIHWVGPAVGAVRRGKWNARLNEACKFIAPFSRISFKREGHGLNDFGIKDLLQELRRLTVVDGSAAKDGVAVGRITEHEYSVALAEEAREREAPPKPKEVARSSLESVAPVSETPSPAIRGTSDGQPNLPELRAAIETVGAQSGRWNWVLCGFPKGSAPSLARLPPSPLRSRRPKLGMSPTASP